MFYLDDNRAAQQLRELESIQSKDGQLRVLVKPSPPPKGATDGGGGGGRGGERRRGDGERRRGDGERRRGDGGRWGARSPMGQQYRGRRDSDEDMGGGDDATMSGDTTNVIQVR